MARVEQKILKTVPLLAAPTTTTIHVMDITNYSGIAVTITCPALAAGTMFLEWCGFNSTVDADWSAVPTAQYPNATVTLAASTSKVVNAHGLHIGFIRIRTTLSAGAGNYDFYITAKDF